MKLGRGVLFNVVLLTGAALLLVLPLAPVARAAAAGQSNIEKPIHITAFAVNLGANRPRAQASTVQITISKWSTDAQRDQLMTVLKEKGEQALLTALQKMPPVGTIRTPDSLGYDLRFAREQPWGDGGQQIILATDRPIGFWEAVNQTRSTEYPFTVIELHIKNNGEGEGKMSVATRVIPAGNTLVLENYDIQPVLLNSVKVEK